MFPVISFTGANFSDHLFFISVNFPPVKLSSTVKPSEKSPFTPSTAAAATPFIPPPCSSYACFILDSFSVTLSLAAPITEPITSAMPPNTFLAKSSAAPNFSFIAANMLSTIFLNHSHLLYKSTIAAISATIPITIHVTGFANSAAVKLHTLAIRGCKEVKREVTAVFPIFNKLVPNERIIGRPPRMIPASF